MPEVGKLPKPQHSSGFDHIFIAKDVSQKMYLHTQPVSSYCNQKWFRHLEEALLPTDENIKR